MKNLNLPVYLEDKIYQIQLGGGNNIFKIISYFPLSDNEKQIITNLIGCDISSFDGFRSIFSDHISDQEWENSKASIKKRFQDELISIE